MPGHPLKKVLLASGLLLGFGQAFPTPASEWPAWANTIPPAEKTGNSLVLFSGWEVEGDGSARTIRHREVIQIGSDPEPEDSIIIIYHDEFMTVSRVGIWVRDARGKVRQIQEKKLIDYGNSDPTQFTDKHIFIVHPPSAGPGSILAFDCEWISSGFPRDTLEVQGRLKVRRAEVRVKTAPGWKIQGWRWIQEKAQVLDARAEGFWAFDDIPALVPFRNAEGHETEPLPWMVVLDWVPPGGQAAFASWNGFARFFADLYSSPGGEHPRLDQLAADLKQNGGDPVAAATRAARKIRYFASEVGWGRFQPRPPERTIVNGTGDCKDKAQLSLALFNILGLKAHLVLISKQGGPDFNPELPGFWFNHEIAGIPFENAPSPPGATMVDAPGIGKIRLIDMTLDPGSSADTEGLTGAWGLVLDPRTIAPFQIPAPQAIQNIWRSQVLWSLPLNEPESLRYEVELLGSFQVEWESHSEEDQRKTVSRILLSQFPAAYDLKWGGCKKEDERSLVCSFTGVLPAENPVSGQYRTFSLGSLVNLEIIPTPPSEGSAGIDLGWARVYTEKVTLSFPGRRLVRAPRVIDVDNPSGRAVLTVTTKDSAVEITRELRLLGGHIGGAQAADLRALREALREMNAAAVLLAPLGP